MFLSRHEEEAAVAAKEAGEARSKRKSQIKEKPAGVTVKRTGATPLPPLAEPEEASMMVESEIPLPMTFIEKMENIIYELGFPMLKFGELFHAKIVFKSLPGCDDQIPHVDERNRDLFNLPKERAIKDTENRSVVWSWTDLPLVLFYTFPSIEQIEADGGVTETPLTTISFNVYTVLGHRYYEYKDTVYSTETLNESRCDNPLCSENIGGANSLKIPLGHHMSCPRFQIPIQLQIPDGCVILFRRDLAHAGGSYDAEIMKKLWGKEKKKKLSRGWTEINEQEHETSLRLHFVKMGVKSKGKNWSTVSGEGTNYQELGGMIEPKVGGGEARDGLCSYSEHDKVKRLKTINCFNPRDVEGSNPFFQEQNEHIDVDTLEDDDLQLCCDRQAVAYIQRIATKGDDGEIFKKGILKKNHLYDKNFVGKGVVPETAEREREGGRGRGRGRGRGSPPKVNPSPPKVKSAPCYTNMDNIEMVKAAILFHGFCIIDHPDLVKYPTSMQGLHDLFIDGNIDVNKSGSGGEKDDKRSYAFVSTEKEKASDAGNVIDDEIRENSEHYSGSLPSLKVHWKTRGELMHHFNSALLTQI